MYACLGEHDGELSFEPNQIITNGTMALQIRILVFVLIVCVCVIISVKSSQEPGWLEGTLNGKTGLIPENYVEILP